MRQLRENTPPGIYASEMLRKGKIEPGFFLISSRRRPGKICHKGKGSGDRPEPFVFPNTTILT
jgi:hypothetical protein